MPGKTVRRKARHDPQLAASMRPQRNAGENEHRNPLLRGEMKCFNEAPAKCRGKQNGARISFEGIHRASMRPQRNAGENAAQTILRANGVLLQ